MGKHVVIVESPAKAKTINRYLGSDFEVLASFGHVRDLPSKDGSVLPDADFEMLWSVEDRGKKQMAAISKALKGADRLSLATDPDREGEAIAWHVLEILNEKNLLDGIDVERVVFNAITKKSILAAMQQPRSLDNELVDAYLARRALDYLVGFTLSPVLWRKLPGSRSAGRVQSVALRLICDRELEIEKFVNEEYWTVEAKLAAESGQPYDANLYELGGERLKKFDLNTEALARDAKAKVESVELSVIAVESRPMKRNPQPPFTTSTLQQEASRKLGFNVSRTMQVAQRLYEGMEINGETTGLITYMRTDGVQMADEAIDECRATIGSTFDKRYLPEKSRHYQTKAKNAQEAHEAIRPTSFDRHPDELKAMLEDEQLKLYTLVWRRAIASQMASAEQERTTITMKDRHASVTLRSTGTVTVFDGFLTLYQESRDDGDDQENGGRLPQVKAGDAVSTKSVEANQHFTEPPPRFTEATLVKRMEELGIGRPSTYASILGVLRDRSYVTMDRNRFVPEDKGRLVTAFLESFFGQYVQYDFTAQLEEKLDDISAGKREWKAVLREFWDGFAKSVDGTKDLRITEVLDALNVVLGPHVFPDDENGEDPRKCPTCESGQLSLKVGRFGAFVGCSNYPDCKFTRQFTKNGGGAEGELAQGEVRLLGQDPETGIDITLRLGRFGPYLQLGESTDDKQAKRGSVPDGIDPNTLAFERAVVLINLPRDIGDHPETGKPIVVSVGRYGPFLLHDGKYTSLSDPEEIFTIGTNRAVILIAETKSRGGRRGAEPIKELGEHPDDGKEVTILKGRFGPYVKHGSTNASIPASMTPEELLMSDAVELLTKAVERKANRKTTTKKKTTRKKAAKKKTVGKKKAAAKKKTSAKKSAD